MRNKSFTEKRPKGMSRAMWMTNRGVIKEMYYHRLKAEQKAMEANQPPRS